jgi:hypothetical protein
MLNSLWACLQTKLVDTECVTQASLSCRPANTFFADCSDHTLPGFTPNIRLYISYLLKSSFYHVVTKRSWENATFQRNMPPHLECQSARQARQHAEVGFCYFWQNIPNPSSKFAYNANEKPVRAGGLGCFLFGALFNGPPLWYSGQSFWLQTQRSWFDFRRRQILWEVAGLEQGPPSRVRILRSYLNDGYQLRSMKPRSAVRTSCSHHLASFYLQKLKLKFADQRQSSVGIVHLWTKISGVRFLFSHSSILKMEAI